MVISGLKHLISLLLSASSVFGIYVRDDVALASFNSLAGDSRFAAGGYVGLAGSGTFCSGTLVAPSVVLTAGHCVDSDTNGVVDLPVGGLAFGTEANPLLMVANVASVVVNPLWVSSLGNAAFDLALLNLSAPINTVTPATLGFALNPTGMDAVMLGYGYQGTGTADFNTIGTRRAAENVIDVTGGTLLTDFDSPAGDTSSFGPATPRFLEGTTAPGDSGGPLFAMVGSDAYLVGVLHGGYNPFGPDSWYGDVSIYTAINSTANRTFLAANGLVAVPEPTPWVMVLMGSSLMMMGLRGRWRQ